MAKKKGPTASGTDGGGAPSPEVRKISTQTVTDFNSNNVKIGGGGGKKSGSSPGASDSGIKGAKLVGQDFTGAPPLTSGPARAGYTAGHRAGTRGKR